MKLKLVETVEGAFDTHDFIFAETETEQLDANFASAVLRNVSDDFLADLIAAARKERTRRVQVKEVNTQFANIMAFAKANGIDLIDANTGEILDGSYYFS